MDFEEQLEKAESLSAPSLVGASLRSADDSCHLNYIHPEKSKTSPFDFKKEQTLGLSNRRISSSLDDLMNEGALLGSEEDIDNLLDSEGHIKDHAKYLAKSKQALEALKAKGQQKATTVDETHANSDAGSEKISETHLPVQAKVDANDNEKEKEKESKNKKDSGALNQGSINKASDLSNFYSTPNLSEYQVENQIKDHNEFVDRVKSYDPHYLPNSQAAYASHKSKDENTATVQHSSSKEEDRSALSHRLSENDEGVRLAAYPIEGMHTPFFYSDSTSRSRSRARGVGSSPSRSNSKPHLARGDSYKNTTSVPPERYELPPDMYLNEEKRADTDEGEDSRMSRKTRPTMGESIAAAEAHEAAFASSDPSLVTTGDYTNFDVDTPHSTKYYGGRSSSSTNYLRSISRSRSRAMDPVSKQESANHANEKNDANPEELAKEGALITDDPYSTIGDLDTMVEEVLHVDSEGNEIVDESEANTPVVDVATKPNYNKDQKEHTNIQQEQSEKVSPSDEKSPTGLMDRGVDKSGRDDRTNEKESITPKVDSAGKTELDSSYDKKNAENDGKASREYSVESKENTVNTINEIDGDVKDVHERKTLANNSDTGTPSLKDAKTEAETENIASDKVGSEEQVNIDENKEAMDSKEPTSTEPVSAEASRNQPSSKPESQIESSHKGRASDPLADLEDINFSPEELRKYLESQPVYVFTSLAGGMQIMTRTNRVATILKANGVHFEYRDLGTDEAAKKIWKRGADGRTLPGVVRGDDFVGNWQQLEDANEEYRVREILYETL